MVPRKILWFLDLFDGDDNCIIFNFAVATILLSLSTQLTVITNIQIIALLGFFIV